MILSISQWYTEDILLEIWETFAIQRHCLSDIAKMQMKKLFEAIYLWNMFCSYVFQTL